MTESQTPCHRSSSENQTLGACQFAGMDGAAYDKRVAGATFTVRELAIMNSGRIRFTMIGGFLGAGVRLLCDYQYSALVFSATFCWCIVSFFY